jgi:hypothetical protein
VWQAIHLNIPPPGEAPYKQILRRVGWSILAIVAPELVALNAWLQYRDARILMTYVNRCRKLQRVHDHQPRLKRLLDYLRWLSGKLGMMCMSVLFIVDRLRMLLRHRPELHGFEIEQQQLRNESVLAQLNKDQLPWGMDTAFYALCGGNVVLTDDGSVKTLDILQLSDLAKGNHATLLPIQRAMEQDPSKASGLAKFITCAQAFWFCSQCIARLSENMAISLLELNTFAHCISAFFIYVFWWHKPYDVATHAYIDLSNLPQDLVSFLWDHTTHLSGTRIRSKNMAREAFNPIHWALAGFWRPLIMVLTFFIYGAMHLLAWQYHFPTNAERTTWRYASIATASSGIIVLVTIVRGSDWFLKRRYLTIISLSFVIYLLGFAALAARSFLVIESFRALPNSPASIYEVPRWSAYVPHI